jgi:hypothetical protein
LRNKREQWKIKRKESMHGRKVRLKESRGKYKRRRAWEKS